MFLQDQVTVRAVCPPYSVTSSLPDTLSLPTDPGLYFKSGDVQKEASSEGRKSPDQCANVNASLNFLGRGKWRGVLIPWECYSVTWASGISTPSLTCYGVEGISLRAGIGLSVARF